MFGGHDASEHHASFWIRLHHADHVGDPPGGSDAIVVEHEAEVRAIHQQGHVARSAEPDRCRPYDLEPGIRGMVTQGGDGALILRLVDDQNVEANVIVGEYRGDAPGDVFSAVTRADQHACLVATIVGTRHVVALQVFHGRAPE
jgi:hypothetical protein